MKLGHILTSCENLCGGGKGVGGRGESVGRLHRAWRGNRASALPRKARSRRAKVMVMMARRIRWSGLRLMDALSASRGCCPRRVRSGFSCPGGACDEVDDDAEVAGEHGDDEQQQQSGVGAAGTWSACVR